jgi:hypothetical protein
MMEIDLRTFCLDLMTFTFILTVGNMELLNDINAEALAANSRSSLMARSGLRETSTSEEIIAYLQRIKLKLQNKTRPSRSRISQTVDDMSDEQVKAMMTMLPDEVIQNPSSFEIRKFEAAVLSLDVSGFTDLSERYQLVENGASKLSMVLNSYLGNMVVSFL